MAQITRFIGNGQPWSVERAHVVAAEKRKHWSRHGFGWRAAVEHASGRAVGIMSANLVGVGTAGVDPSDHEIGWWVDPAAWGRGLAREGARALCEELFDVVGAASVVARIQPANAASIRVAERTGLCYEALTTGPFGEAVAVYRLAAVDWRCRGEA
jgi:RimJ/RimL family protein N-acetyltransferase